MTTINDVTGDKIESRVTNDKFRDGWDIAFGKVREEIKERAVNSDPVVTFEKGQFAGMTREEAKEEVKRELFGSGSGDAPLIPDGSCKDIRPFGGTDVLGF